MKKLCAALCALALLILCAGALAEDNWLASVLAQREAQEAPASQAYAAVLYIDSEIIAYDYYYDHEATLDVIDALAQDEENAALLLVLNTPGGGLYEADELHHALETYKQTGRPVYAYMAQECCSAGVYAAMAADTIFASRMTLTGNVGVYMQTYSEAGLYEKLGVENEYISSGENKVAGYPQLTQAQREIYEEIVAESFAYFKDVIAASRGLTQEQMQPFMDGRLLTGTQAKEMGLVDEVIYLDEALARISEELTGSKSGYIPFEDVTPQIDYGYESSEPTAMDWLHQLIPDAAQEPQGIRRRTNAIKSRMK